jgi:DNA-binding GntR family transcriptional regulator
MEEERRMAEAKPRKPLADNPAVHDQIYQSIRQAVITGRIAPGVGVSLRSLAAELGVSPMPVRDAVRRLVAERALAINPANKRLSVPSLTAGRLEQLSLARLWIEPELAARAAPNVDAALVKRLRELDAAVDDALKLGDVDAYMSANHDFHFAIYARAEAEVLLAMAGGLWLQIGPFMRVVFGRVGADGLVADRHVEAVEALKVQDAEGARRAIAADLSEGMDKMRAAVEAGR